MALCGVYALFFAVQAGEWLAAAPLGLDAPDTAAFAVNGFWELLKILLLDFSVLAGIQFFGRAPLPKALAAVFCGFGVAFAALAAGKLAVYVTLCALTPGGSQRHGACLCWPSVRCWRWCGCSSRSRRRSSRFLRQQSALH